jgi:hypothetical protein
MKLITQNKNGFDMYTGQDALGLCTLVEVSF